MPLFRTPVDVEVTWADGRVERRRIDLFRQSHDWRIPGPAAPKRFLFDPDGWLLARIRETKERTAWDAVATDATAPIASRIRAVRALGGLGVDAVPALSRAATTDARFEVRAEACTALGKVGGDAAASALAAAAQDGESRVRRPAVNALANFPARLAGAALAQRIATDKSQYVVADASAALGKVKAEGAYDLLVATLARDSHRDQIRQKVMDGLRELGDPRGAAVARGYLDYAWGKGIQHQLRKAALDAMCALDPASAETKAALLRLLPDPYFRMKGWAAEKCADLKILDAVPVLESTARDAIGPGVRDAAKAALERLTGKKAEPKK
jgi:HEAT repeat protein